MPPPRTRLWLLIAALAAASLMALLVPRPAGAASALRDRWRSPVPGALVGAFAYARSAPFAAGARRGIDIAARPGDAVRSACRGRVTFAGAVPGGRGLGVTVRCGALVATHLGLARLAVRRGVRVAAGTRLGVVGPAGRVRLGARRAADRFGYLDPLALLRGDGPPDGPALPEPAGRRGPRVPAVAPPAGRAVPLGHAPQARVAPAPAAQPAPLVGSPRVRTPVPPPAPRPRPAARPRPGTAIPAAAWAGLILLAAGVPLGGLVRRRRGRSVPVEAATSPAAGR
jgi:Peptidase family M23